MSVRGVGTDVVDVAKLRRTLDRTPGFEARVFDPAEVAYCRAKADPVPSFAARFAAKEAVMKALGTGWGYGVDFLDIVVTTESSGAPRVLLRNEAAARAGGGQVHVSLSHAAGVAMAFAVLDGGE